jgi:hypothetical protein
MALLGEDRRPPAALASALGSVGDPFAETRAERLWKNVLRPILEGIHAGSSTRVPLELVDIGAVAGDVVAAARLDPILPTLTDEPEALDRQFTALAQVGVKRIAASVLFLRPGILYSLTRRVPREMLAPLLKAYRQGEEAVMCGAQHPIQNLSLERRREIFARLQEAAETHGIRLDICACKNSDIARVSCNIAGTWPARPDGRPFGLTPRAAQPAFIS